MIRIHRNSLPMHLSGWVVALAMMFLSHSIVAQEVFLEDALDAVLKKNCLACHNQKLAEGGLNMESVELMRKGGDSGSAIDVAMPEKSLLVGRASGTVDEIMPPDGNTVGAERLNPEQLALLQKWIAGGAKVRGTMPIARARGKLADTFRASYAVAISPTNDTIAFGRGSKLVLQSANRLANATPTEPAWIPSGAPQVLDAHDDFIHSMAFHPDGNRLVTGSTGQVKLWKRATATLELDIALPKDKSVRPLAVSADRTRLISIESIPAVNDQPASVQCVVSAKDGNVLNALTIPEGDWTVGMWTPNGTRVVLRNATGKMILIDVAANPMTMLGEAAPAAPGRGLIAINDEQFLLVTERRVEAWQIKAPNLLEKIDHPLANAISAAGPVDELAMNEDRTLVAANTQDAGAGMSSIKVWSVPQNKMVASLGGDKSLRWTLANRSREALRAQAWVNRVQASIGEMEKSLQAEQNAVNNAVASRDKAEQAHVAKEKEMQTAMQAITDHEKAIADAKAAVEAATLKMNQLITELEPKKKTLGEVEKQKATAKTMWDNSIAAVKSAEESQKSAQAKLENEKKILVERQSVQGEKQSKEAEQKTAAETFKLSIQNIAFVGKEFVAGVNTLAGSNPIEVFSIASGERVDSLTGWNPNNYTLALAKSQSLEPRWELEHTWEDPAIVSDRATAIAFHPDGTKFAVGSGPASRGGHVAIVQIADRSLVHRFENLHSDSVLGLSFSPDARYLVSCGADKQTKLVDLSKMAVQTTLEGHTHHVMAVAWQDDCQRIATAGADATIKIWDVEKGESTKTIQGLGVELTSIAFVGTTPNLMTSSVNNLVRMHDANSGNQVRQYGGAADSLYAVSVSANGKYVVATGQEGIARVWWVDDGKLLTEIK